MANPRRPSLGKDPVTPATTGWIRRRDKKFKKLFDSEIEVPYITGADGDCFLRTRLRRPSEPDDRPSHLLRGGVEKFCRLACFFRNRVGSRDRNVGPLLYDNCIGRKRDVGGVVVTRLRSGLLLRGFRVVWF